MPTWRENGIAKNEAIFREAESAAVGGGCSQAEAKNAEQIDSGMGWMVHILICENGIVPGERSQECENSVVGWLSPPLLLQFRNG